MKRTLWIIEDMVDLQPVYQNIFDEEIYSITFFEAFDEFKSEYVRLKDDQLPELIIADIMLKDGHFIKLLNDSDITLNTPYLVISSSDDIETIRTAFEAGAIDYLLKPFNYNETLAKVERHLKTIEDQNQEISKSLEALNLNLDAFTNKEVRIIESFNANKEKSLHRSDIVNIIWKNVTIHPNTLDVHIYNLRRKLKKENFTIKAIGGGVFKFIEINPQLNPKRMKMLKVLIFALVVTNASAITKEQNAAADASADFIRSFIASVKTQKIKAKIDSCPFDKAKWLVLLLSGNSFTEKLEYTDKCDLKGSYTPKKGVLFPVKLDVRNVPEFNKVQFNFLIKLDYGMKPVVKLNMKNGSAIGSKNTVSFEADYQGTIDISSQELKPTNQSGTIKIKSINGKQINKSYPLKLK